MDVAAASNQLPVHSALAHLLLESATSLGGTQPIVSVAPRSTPVTLPASQIFREGKQAGEPISRVHVLLKNVEGEVVCPAKGPNSQGQQQCASQRTDLDQQQNRRRNPDGEEQNGLYPDGGWAFEVLHTRSVKPRAVRASKTGSARKSQLRVNRPAQENTPMS